MLNYDMKTPWTDEALIASVPWNEHPAPQFKRDTWMNLNGRWDFSVINKEGTDILNSEILVPYPPESMLSGIKRVTQADETLLYSRSFSLPASFGKKGRVLLHIGACDQMAVVSVNDSIVGTHQGGYLPFSFDITPHLAKKNRLEIAAMDPLDPDLPYGKQCYKRKGMWYTPISGLWKTVWLEWVPESYVESFRLTPSLTSVALDTVGGETSKTLEIQTEEGLVKESFSGDHFVFSPSHPHLWTPEDPYLYYFTLTCGEDKIESYFALRTVSSGEDESGRPRLLLNEKPYFFNGLLDQGYFSDGIYTPASPEAFRFDISQCKKLGFNTLRKHIKIEPEAFYYECDRLGMIVFQDMVNNGPYSFFVDTALPTIGFKGGAGHLANARKKKIFTETALEMLSHLYNYPCICLYTIFNEGWGQCEGTKLYKLLSAADPTRLYDTASGWFNGVASDVQSEHIYFKKLKIRFGKKPVLLSEYGGFSYRIVEHSFNNDNNYAYAFYDSCEALQNGLQKLFDTELKPLKEQGLSGAILTQVSDVEDETNGLFTYDRQVIKVQPFKF